MSKSKSLPSGLKSLLASPLYPSARSSTSRLPLPAGRSASPTVPASSSSKLQEAFSKVKNEAEGNGLGWGEWLTIATATVITLNSPSSLASLHHFALPNELENERKVERALLMREVGLKCIGFVGIPKVINNLAALRKEVGKDNNLVSSLPTEPRRKISTQEDLTSVQSAAYKLWDDIYQPLSDRLIEILGTSHPDLPVFIIDGEYGPLFSPPYTFKANEKEPIWEVGRIRTSLVAISALRAQGGVGPQVTSHIWGLIKAANSIQQGIENEGGLKWLCGEGGAEWVVKSVNELSQVVESGAQEKLVEEVSSGAGGRESKL